MHNLFRYDLYLNDNPPSVVIEREILASSMRVLNLTLEWNGRENATKELARLRQDAEHGPQALPSVSAVFRRERAMRDEALRLGLAPLANEWFTRRLMTGLRMSLEIMGNVGSCGSKLSRDQ
jgi:hypothetical protein